MKRLSYSERRRARNEYRLWLDQSVRTSPLELAFLAIGHVALGVIIGFGVLA